MALAPDTYTAIAHPLTAPDPTCATRAADMASQDQISQFSDLSQGVPASQPDRPRTPQRDVNSMMQAPRFYGPMATAMSTTRPPQPNPTMWYPPSFPRRPQWNQWTQHTQGYPAPHPTQAPPRFPPVPPPPCFSSPQRYMTTSPKQSSPHTPSPQQSSIRQGYTCRPCEVPPVDTWTPDIDFHDTTKVNGMDFPACIRSSQFASFKDIEGMDPLQVPLWKFLYQGIRNTWLRRIAYGRETYHPVGQHWIHSFHFRTHQPTSIPQHRLGSPGQLQISASCMATISHKRKPLSRWPKKLPNSCNPGSLYNNQLIHRANNESGTSRPRSQSSNLPVPLNRPHLLRRPREHRPPQDEDAPLLELFMDKVRHLHSNLLRYPKDWLRQKFV